MYFTLVIIELLFIFYILLLLIIHVIICTYLLYLIAMNLSLGYNIIKHHTIQHINTMCLLKYQKNYIFIYSNIQHNTLYTVCINCFI